MKKVCFIVTLIILFMTGNILAQISNEPKLELKNFDLLLQFKKLLVLVENYPDPWDDEKPFGLYNNAKTVLNTNRGRAWGHNHHETFVWFPNAEGRDSLEVSFGCHFDDKRQLQAYYVMFRVDTCMADQVDVFRCLDLKGFSKNIYRNKTDYWYPKYTWHHYVVFYKKRRPE